MHYESYFGLAEAPFSISPDPRFLYLTPGHREALAHLLYGIKSQGGFVLLTGEVGAGKTTVCRCLLEQLPDNIDVALVLNPLLGAAEFLAAICDELGIDYPEDISGLKGYMDRIQQYLLAAHGDGRDVVLIVDEAQNLNRDVMEHLRLLTNLETNEKKLLQIILIGQPELRDFIAQSELQQMAQRITARFHLAALNDADVGAYIYHRLQVAGYDADSDKIVFPRQSIRYIAKISGGIPRLINVLCDRALLGTWLTKTNIVSLNFCKAAAREVLPGKVAGRRALYISGLRWFMSVSLLLAIAFATVFFLRREVWPAATEDPLVHWGASDTPVVESDKDVLEAVAPHQEEVHENMLGKILHNVRDSVRDSVQDSVQDNFLGNADTDSDTAASVDSAHKAGGLLLQRSYLSLEQEAFKTIFTRWGLAYEPDLHGPPCAFARAQGLRCLVRTGNMKLLMALDRPTVLTLYDQRGGKVPAVFMGSTDEEVILNIAGQVERLPLKQFSTWWLGGFTALWQPPAGLRGSIKYGDRGAVVGWLLEHLGETIVDRNSAVFNRAVSARLQEFQGANGLVPDGVAGPLSIITLQNVAGLPMPGLSVE